MKARITNIVIDVIAVQNKNKNSKPMDLDHQTFFVMQEQLFCVI